MIKYGAEDAGVECCKCHKPLKQGQDSTTCVECGGTAELEDARNQE